MHQDRAPNAPSRANVSAIVVSYFTGPVLARAIEALQRQTEICEIILVDNGNFAKDIERAKAAGGPCPLRILSGHGNIGFAAACNKGAAAAGGDYLLFINPDAVTPQGGLAQMLEDSARLERPWLMGARLVGPDGAEQQGSRRDVLTPWRAFVEVTRLYKLAPKHPYFSRFNKHDEKRPEDIVQTPTVSGACLFLHRDDYNAIGGMDEHYFLHVEDIDFCLRFAKAGGGVYFNPRVNILHYKSSSRANPIRIEALKTAGLIRYFNTHFSEAYPRVFLWLVAGAMWAAFGLLAAKRAIAKFFRLMRLGWRAGTKGVKRAIGLGARQSSR